MGNIPDETVEDILLRLPVKSLLRFRRVSHAWKATISNPIFAKLHLKLAKNRARSFKLMLISVNQYQYYPDDHILHSVDHHDYDGDDAAVLNVCPLGDYSAYKTIGSSDGLLLVIAHYPYEFRLCNPSTGHCQRLPTPDNLSNHSFTTYGFGSDNDKENYKVLIMQLHKDQSALSTDILLFTTSTNSWRRIRNIPYKIRSNDRLVLVNGNLHYLSLNLLLNEDVILSFDIGREEFREVSAPSYSDYGHATSSIAVLKGNLCVVSSFNESHERRSNAIWVMTEYGLKGSWTKMFSITTRSCYSMFPLHFSWNGQILLQVNSSNRTRLVYYDYKNHSKRFVKLKGLPKQFETLNYVESLVLPKICVADDKLSQGESNKDNMQK